MALAHDASTKSTIVGTSLTFAHGCSGSNRVLFVAILTNTSDNTDYVTGVTYNGVAMTRVDQFRSPGLGGAYLYMLVNPASGTNDIIISCSSSVAIYGASSSYTGAKQTSQPNVAGGNASDPVTSLNVNVITTQDNCWLVSCAIKKNGSAATLSVGTGVTLRQNNDDGVAIGDSNGPKSPAGSYGQEWNVSSSTGLAVLVAAIAPAESTVTGSNDAYFM